RERRQERAIDGGRDVQAGNQGSSDQWRNQGGPRGERRKADDCGKTADQQTAESSFQRHLQGQAQRQHSTVRKQQSRTAARESTRPHRARREERATDRRRNGETRESAEGHQPASESG